MKPNEDHEKKRESVGWSPKQYLAFIIAIFQTVLLPVLILIVVFVVLAILIGYI